MRKLIYNPGFQNHNLGLFKDFVVKERHRIHFPRRGVQLAQPSRLERPEHNPTNIVLDSAGKVDLQSSTFGKISGKGGNRELQFALRYQF